MAERPQAPEPQSAYADAGRIVAVGDLHGNYSGLRRILSETGLVGGEGRWIARDTHLVLMGDVLGRGGEPGKIFALVRRLEAEAPARGSRVHLLLGNHEALALRGVIRYNTLEEFRDLANADWTPAGPRFGGPETDPDGDGTDPVLEAKLDKRLDMLGARAFRTALSPRGAMGAWLLSHASAVAVNGHLFVHGGLNRAYGRMHLDELNARVRSALAGAADAEAAMLRGDGPQWNREYILQPGRERQDELEEVLAFHACRRMVVGHTPTACIAPRRKGRVLPLYGGRLYCIDTGIGRAFGEHLSALSLEDGEPEALYFA
jgi:hypothetical protein